MRYYVPLQTADGWAVCYCNHRNEFQSIMECRTLQSAYIECVNLTSAALLEATAILGASPKARTVHNRGSRYVRA